MVGGKVSAYKGVWVWVSPCRTARCRAGCEHIAPACPFPSQATHFINLQPTTHTLPHPSTSRINQFAGAGSRNFRLSALHDHERAGYHKEALQQLKAARRYER